LYISHAMRRRVFGEEIAAEPSQFLNEMPLELIEDLSYGSSWLSFARSSTTLRNKQAVSALRGERPVASKPKNLYTGKTYNTADAVAEFFKKKNIQPGGNASSSEPESARKPEARPLSGLDKLRAIASEKPKATEEKPAVKGSFVAGSHVRHEKYGKGLVLRREGSGDNVKLTISFPGFGQKKMIEKFANLQKA